MFFEYTFQINDSEIVYFFEVARNGSIVKETLSSNGKIYIERKNRECDAFFGGIKAHYGNADVQENSLFLKAFYIATHFMGNADFEEWFSFMKRSIYVNPSRDVQKLISFNDPQEKYNIRIKDYLDEFGTDEINEFFDTFSFPFRIKYKKTDNTRLGLISFNDSLTFVRKGLPNIPLTMESYGNNVLMIILPSFLTIAKKGGMLIIDEFSSGLHNKLEELLLSYFFKKSTNAQLVFVSHSTNLLTTSLLRPDQIYATTFDGKSSSLMKFSDERPREGQNLEKMYLGSVFGGLPLYDKKAED